MELIVATNNAHKTLEFKRMLSQFFDNVYSLKDKGIVCDAEETGATFAENALIKAQAVCDVIKAASLEGNPFVNGDFAVLADDSGLMVDALGGEPGVYSARYAALNGGNATDKENRDKLLHNLEGVKNRTARFVSSLALICGENILQVEGTTEGRILYEEQGENGFGYDCIFESSVLNKSFGLATAEEKDSVSHRAQAATKMVEELKKLF